MPKYTVAVQIFRTETSSLVKDYDIVADNADEAESQAEDQAEEDVRKDRIGKYEWDLDDVNYEYTAEYPEEEAEEETLDDKAE